MKKKPTLETLIARTQEEGQCMTWQGYFGNGVPMVSNPEERGMISVRRLILQLTGKNPPDGGFIAPRCGNRQCVNPQHLQHRTQRQHMAHIASEGSKNEMLNELRKAKISKAKRQISDTVRQAIIDSPLIAALAAKKYGVSVSTVKKYRVEAKTIKLGNVWAGLIR